jgi:hypothetical protein
MSTGAFLRFPAFYLRDVARSENGRRQDERAVSRTISAAPALTTRKRRNSLYDRRKRAEAMQARRAHLHSVNRATIEKRTT